MEETTQKQKALPVATPLRVTLSLINPFGPFAGRARRRIKARAINLAIQNLQPTELPVRFSFEPVARESDGSFADATLSLSNLKESLGPGEMVVCRLACQGALPPGRYLSSLQIVARDSKDACEVPIVISVAAHWLWVLGFLLCGLLFLGLCAIAREAADLSAERAKVLALQQTLREFTDSGLLSSTERRVVRSAEEAISKSLEIQSQPRPWTLRDWRLELALQERQSAFDLWKQLDSKRGQSRPAASIVEELDQEWKALSARVKDLKEWNGQPDTQFPNENWSARIRDFGQRQFRLVLSGPIYAIEEEIGPQIERVLLAWAAGDSERVRDLAPKVHHWLRSAARVLEEYFDLGLAWRAVAKEMEQRYEALATLTKAPALPEFDRLELSTRMDLAKNAMGTGDSLEGFKEASRILQEAETYALSVQAQALIDKLGSAVNAVSQETDISEIEEAIEKFLPTDSSEVKKEKLLAVMELWRSKIVSCRDEALRKSLLERVAKISQQIEAGEPPEAVKSLFTDWSAYGQQRLEAVRRELILPLCGSLSDRLRTDFATANEALRLLEPHPGLAGLAEKLDHIQTTLDGLDEEHCLETIVTLKGNLVEVGAAMFTNLVVRQTASSALVQAAESSGVAEARDLAQRMLAEPRPLRITLRTPADQLYAGRQVMFEIGDLAPEWGAGVKLSFDFGDKAVLERTADQFRQERIVTHRYDRPMVVNPRIAAFRESASAKKTAELVGEGELKHIMIQPSSITTAQLLRDQFINLRFVLALVVALAIQCIRLSSGNPFGARGLDYVEAFAIGLSVDTGLRVLLGALNG